MKRLGLVLALAAMAGCATTSSPYAPVRDIAYQAMGSQLFWMLTIGDGRIVLRTAGAPDAAWPRTLPRIVDGVRTWQSGEGGNAIMIEARPGPCTADGRTYADDVTVRTGGSELTGCGGQLVEREGGGPS